MIRVLFAASEATPFAQTGGLGEVCGSLPHALARAGCEVRLVLPRLLDERSKELLREFGRIHGNSVRGDADQPAR